MPSLRHEMAVRLVKAQPRLTPLPIEAARLLMHDFSHLFPMPDGVTTRAERVGALAAEWLLPDPEPPATQPLGTMLYLHGGGYCVGSIDSHRALASRIGLAACCRTLLIDYRLAPEHPFPAALDDACSAYDWLLDSGVSNERLLVAGDSAGGGLALALLLALNERRRPLPAGAVCLSPWTDLAMSGDSARNGEVDDPMVRLPEAQELAALYAQDHDPREPLISPLHGDLAGLPPLLLQVGTRELLLDDSRRFASAAREAAVDVTLEEWEGLMHVWQIFAPMVPESVEAIASLGSWSRALLDKGRVLDRTTAA